MRTSSRVLAALLLGALAALGARAELPPEKQKWFEGRSAHFQFITDEGKSETAEQVQAFEILYEILRIVSPDLRRGRPSEGCARPNFVYLFATAKGFQSYSELTGIDGFFVARPDGNFIAMNSSAPKSIEIAHHEYLHQFLSANCPRVPVWLNEGMACFFETIRIDGQEIVLGTPPDGFLPTLANGGIMPVAQLVAVSRQSRVYQTESERLKFYATAWLLTDYLMTSGETNRAQLGQYLDLLRSDHPVDECYRLAFGRAPEALDKELAEYLRRLGMSRRIATWILHFKNLRADLTFSFTDLPRAEALGRLGLLLLSGKPESKARAREHFLAALALDPESYAGNLGQGMVALMDHNLSGGASAFEKASLRRPEDPQLHLLAATSLFARIGSAVPPEADSAGRRTARNHLVRALEQGSTDPSILGLLSDLVLSVQAPEDEDISAIEVACRCFPTRYDLKITLAALYGRIQKNTAAHEALQEVATQSADPASAAIAHNQLADLDRQEAARLYQKGMDAFKQKRYDEAVATLEEAIRRSPNPGQQKEFQENLSNMKQLIALRTEPSRKAVGAKHH